MTESRVRAQIACWAIDRLGTDPVSAIRAAHIVRHTHDKIACLDDPDRCEALAKVQQAYERWCVRLCSEDTGPCETVEIDILFDSDINQRPRTT